MRRNFSFCSLLFCLTILLTSGCGSSASQLGRVQGRITFKGRPLADAQVEFQPVKGAPSYAITNTDGIYDLSFTARSRGALIGEHTVRITTDAEVTVSNSETIRTPELLPDKYHAKSELKKEVKRGRNRIDFDL